MSHLDEQAASKSPPSNANLRPDVSKELAKLKFEKKNHTQPRLPPNVKIQRRPLNHAPVASPFAGPNVQKVVYVSRKTPIMSAVKRVKKLLSHVEKRAMQGVNLGNDKHGMRKLVEASEKLGKNREAVHVKATGRAMEQALRVAEWFRSKEDELSCSVKVTTGSVQAVDDLIHTEEVQQEITEDMMELGETNAQVDDVSLEDSRLVTGKKTQTDFDPFDGGVEQENQTPDNAESQLQKKKQKRLRKKRKRPVYDADELPEARVRWIKTIDISITLKG